MLDAGNGGEQTGAAEQAELEILQPPVYMIEATRTTTYTAGSVTGNDIWPTNRNIASVEVVYTQGPARSQGPTFLAFVIWNGNYVAHIYCSYLGSIGNSLRNILANTLEERITYGTNVAAIITGSVGGGPVVPLPHPNVDGEITFTSNYLTSIKTQAVNALAASRPVIELPGDPIFEPGE